MSSSNTNGCSQCIFLTISFLPSTHILGNIAYEFIWIPGYYLLSSWLLIFYFLLIFHLTWFIPLSPPKDTLEQQHSDHNPTYANQSYQIDYHTNTAHMTGPSHLYRWTKYQQTNLNDDVDTHELLWLVTMQKLEMMQNSTASHYRQRIPLTQQCTYDTTIHECFTSSTHKQQQWPKHKPSTTRTNKHLLPMETSAFCSCKQQQWVNKRTFAYSA